MIQLPSKEAVLHLKSMWVMPLLLVNCFTVIWHCGLHNVPQLLYLLQKQHIPFPTHDISSFGHVLNFWYKMLNSTNWFQKYFTVHLYCCLCITLYYIAWLWISTNRCFTFWRKPCAKIYSWQQYCVTVVWYFFHVICDENPPWHDEPFSERCPQIQ
jgi:hypothetical protein